MKRNILFEGDSFEQYIKWFKDDVKIVKKINELLEHCTRTPEEGIGKPERLKYGNRGKWSRRITDEHRLVYEVTETTIKVISCYGHYE